MLLAPVENLVGAALAQAVKAKAIELGFDLAGVAPAEPSKHREYLREWLAAGHAATMDYLARRFDQRTDVRAYLPGAASVVCVALNYHTPLEPLPKEARASHARVARYALGDDYHEIIKTRLHALADWMREQVPGSQTRCGVDTAPVLERELAARAGIGWVGKNTCIIHPRLGSWILLGEIITTIPLPADEPVTDHCGSCTRCLDACPTQAITEPYRLDASRCISYLTIEHRGDIAEEFHGPIGDWLYGCDICQDVCPHNHKVDDTTDPALRPRFAAGTLDVHDVMRWSDDDYRQKLRHSAMKRVKLPMLKRNAEIVAKYRNVGGQRDAHETH
jgi:epoxyqueuosine reductase